MAPCQSVTIRFLLLVGIYVVYLTAGAVIFAVIERPEEEELRKTLNDAIMKFMTDHDNCISRKDLNDLLKLVIDAENRGVSAAKRNDSMSTNWSFGQAIFFAASVITTIGYGNVTPLSDGGKLFCIGYAFVGVILTAILFDTIVFSLLQPTAKILTILVTKCLFPHRRVWLSKDRLSLVQIRLIRVSILFLFLFSVVFLLPSFIFDALEEDWTFFDAFYYCFISMTTIGLGDYIPAEDNGFKYRTVYKISATVYLYVGLILVLLAVTSVYQVPELNFHNYFCRTGNGRLSEEEEPEEEEEQQQLIKETTFACKSYSAIP